MPRAGARPTSFAQPAKSPVCLRRSSLHKLAHDVPLNPAHVDYANKLAAVAEGETAAEPQSRAPTMMMLFFIVSFRIFRLLPHITCFIPGCARG